MPVRKSQRRAAGDQWLPYPFTPDEAYAIKAWASGKASEAQQRVAFDWVTRATRLREETFIQGKPDATLIVQGRRGVGLDIVAALNWVPGRT